MNFKYIIKPIMQESTPGGILPDMLDTHTGGFHLLEIACTLHHWKIVKSKNLKQRAPY